MARELDMDPDLLRFDFQTMRCFSRVQRYRRAQKQRNFRVVNAGATFHVRIAAVTPDACALQYMPFIPSAAMFGLALARASGCGRRAICVGRKWRARRRRCNDLAATLSVVPEHISLCAEGDLTGAPLPSANRRFRRTVALRLRWFSHGEIR